MAILDLFSKRNEALPDVYGYDELPDGLRNQIVGIMQEDIGSRSRTRGISWDWVVKALVREHGLPPSRGANRSRFERREAADPFAWCLDYFLTLPNVPQALDVIELAMFLRRKIDEEDRGYSHGRRPGDEVIAELNHRFHEHGVGYQYESTSVRGQIVRVDSELLHADVVKPALCLLAEKGFDGPQEEFLAAHKHYRNGRLREAVSGACHAFESTLKVICEKRKWSQGKGTAGALIQAVIKAGLLPEESQEQLNALDKCLIGLSTLGNNHGRHGAGSQALEVPEHYAAYALHLAASNIVFLIQCHNKMR